MKKTGAQIITEILKKFKIDMVAGIPGGSILPLYDELNRSGINHVLVRQEQAAGFIAQGIARTTGKPAVCFATSGPGAMNLLTSIADARSDSVPIIAITGQVNLSLIGTDAFQEADTFGLSFPITKHSVMVKSAKELLTVLPEAFNIAMNGRPGPVLIDVPRNVQLEECEFDSWPKCEIQKSDVRFHTDKKQMAQICKEAAMALCKAERPVLYLGGGCNTFEGAKAFKDFLSVYQAPVVSSLMGIGAVPASYKGNMGMVGMHGSVAANRAMHDADLVLACGVRFDDRAIGLKDKFCPNAKIVHIDIDAAEINKIMTSDLHLVSDVESAIPVITEILREAANSKSKGKAAMDIKETAPERQTWMSKMVECRIATFSVNCGIDKKSKAANPRKFIADVPELAKAAGTKPSDIIVTTDVGQHQMWASQYYPVEDARTFLTSGSLGTMGFGLPAAIGAALANPKKHIVCFSGDGSIMMNIQELATLAERNLNVTIIVLENGTLGMVYQQQKHLFNKNYSASIFEKTPDLLAIANGFGIETFDADGDTKGQWAKKIFDPKRKGPAFVRIHVSQEEDVLPFVTAGKANIDAIVN